MAFQKAELLKLDQQGVVVGLKSGLNSKDLVVSEGPTSVSTKDHSAARKALTISRLPFLKQKLWRGSYFRDLRIVSHGSNFRAIAAFAEPP
ncbi:hypothetical protein [Sabulibacter ruber]|uniref:hypothetical protein n=1 Tax=Sabulibacter ruber TaxID=2811901 RepID=UPI001A95F8E2|nr:hypothetical protein [Sabulibacter ruber]